MLKLSAVILTNTVTNLIFETTVNCINSLKNSEKFGKDLELEIILVESNKEYDRKYEFPNDVKIIVPEDEFGFHKFLNIGIKESHGDFIALCNNDLIFHKNWFSEITKIALERKDILSFSPIDPNIDFQEKNKSYEIGYKVPYHVKGWCIVCRRKVFDIIGNLDENFTFFYSDNDYALTLLYYNIKHAVITNSLINHLHRVTTNEVKKINNSFFIQKEHISKIPKYLFKFENLKWIIRDERALKDHMIFFNKWGRINSFFLLYKYSIILNSCNLNVIVKMLFRIKSVCKL